VDALAARDGTLRRLMASFNSKGGYLYIDFRWRGLRCREATRLPDNVDNRAQVRRTVRQIDREIAARTFDYLKWFPEGRRATLFARPSDSARPPLHRDHVRSGSTTSSHESARELPTTRAASSRVGLSPSRGNV
jgi:hypothetical protein